MRASNLDAIDLIYDIVKDVSVNGGVYKLRRPVDSNKEDLVINTLPLTNDLHQRGACNINIHVPNIKFDIKGSQPDTKRMNELAHQVIELLTYHHGEDYNAYIENSQIIEQADETYYNIRIKLNLFNY